MRTVLVGSDLSPDSDRALTIAARLSFLSGARVHVYHCLQPPYIPPWDRLPTEEERAEWLSSAELDLEWQVRRVFEDSDAVVSRQVEMGGPVERINSASVAEAADLLVLGPHRPRGALDDLLGTTADRLVRTAEVPILVANGDLSPPLTRVLVLTDFSEASEICLTVTRRWLASLVQRNASPCTIDYLHVSAFAPPSARPIAGRQKLEEMIERSEKQAPVQGVRVIPRIISAPMPEDGIHSVAAESHPQLIALGTHGHNSLVRALIGSVTSKVLRTMPRPILLVPPSAAAAPVPRSREQT
jgi:nucleotide-binding universal stress UspA family protein